MSLATIDIFHVLAALAALLAVAHAGGFLAARAGLPPMVGELVGGLLLGATVLSRVAPDVAHWLIPVTPKEGPVPAMLPVLGFCSQLGLLLLMFLGGLQMRRLVTGRDAKAVGWISSLGVLVPVVAGIAILAVHDFGEHVGPASSVPALHIVLIAALAVTSIPVITRIFMDLGLMETRLARIVLSVAVIEDVLLYIAVSLAVGIAGGEAKADASIPTWLHLAPDSIAFIAWHVGASLLLLAAAAWGFRFQTSRSTRNRLNLIARRSPTGWTIAWLLAVTLLAMLLGLAPIYGALVAGIAASNDQRPEFVKARAQVETIGTGFFIPIYFALIGVSLDLVNALDVPFTLGLLAVGTIVKYGGSLLGARLAGEPKPMATALAISVNARGGPGIVLATTALAAGIIDATTFTALIVLALGTSVAAGGWLARVLRTNPEATRLIHGERLADGTGRSGDAADGAAADPHRDEPKTPVPA